ncbi:MAG: M28 family peptidase [Acidobacteriota bacterium]|nr:M28 family peptidase [Acidobacteriota bacterium]
MRRAAAVTAFFCAAAVVFAAKLTAPSFSAERYLNHIRFLASPEMRGRESGSPELEKAARYIAGQFKAAGLKPVEGKNYLQAFEVTTSAKLGKTNRFDFTSGSDRESLLAGKDFVPFNFSSRGHAAGAVVFAGYGITAPEYNYDDYAGLDVHGKFVIVMAHEPQEYDEKSVFEGKIYTDHAQYYSKAFNARKHGAAGVILINDQDNHRRVGATATPEDDLENFGATAGPADAGILFVQVKASVVASWFRGAGKDLMDVERAIDSDAKPRSFPLPGVAVTESVDVERVVKTVHNVLGYLPGETDEYLIVGAHYDHLGLGGQFSLAPSLAGTVHPGADDNASGTAAVLELARYFSAMPRQKRGILFMTFAGEELGLLGSGYYANHPEMPLNKAVAMINMDMIGRVRDGKLYVGGAGTGTTLRQDLDAVAPQFAALHIDYSDNSGYGSSDHTSFTAKQIPVLFFFSGLHPDYHKPSDTWDKINANAAIQVVQLVADVAGRIDADAVAPKFVRVEEKENPHAGVASSGGSGYGPYFGSIPDFAEPPTGVRFADITPGSPAAKAGLRAGDILINFGGEKIQNLYDFTYALRAHKAGEEVEVGVLRGDTTVTARVQLTERK